MSGIDVVGAARAIAQLTHMDQAEAMRLLDLIVHMDQQAILSVPEEDRGAVGSFPALRDALCSLPLAAGSDVCPKRKRRKINPLTGKAI